jgi:transcriptional regulator with XRE-family HTH domain
MPDLTPGARLAAVRRRLGLTQKQIAEAIGVAPSYVGLVEQGRYVPTLDRVLEIAAALGVDAQELDPRLASTTGTKPKARRR